MIFILNENAEKRPSREGAAAQTLKNMLILHAKARLTIIIIRTILSRITEGDIGVRLSL